MSELLEDLVECHEKIDLLEAELAEARQALTIRADILNDLYQRVSDMEAELADLRASSVVVRRKCKTCGGRSMKRVPDGAGHMVEEFCPNPDCEDGWRLAEGVFREFDEGPDGEWRDYYVVPARRIEGDTNE